MKNLTTLFFTGALALLSLNSCKKKETDNNNTGNTKPTGVVMCKINGTVWQSDAQGKFLLNGSDTVTGIEATLEGDTLSMLSVRFSDTSAVLMQLILTSGRTGTYSGTTTASVGVLHMESVDLAGALGALLGYTTTYSVNITKWDATNRKFSGTFSLTMTPVMTGTTKTITEGEFYDVIYDN